MGDQDFQIFNPLQGFGKTLASTAAERIRLIARTDTPGIGYPQLHYLSLGDHFTPPIAPAAAVYNQPAQTTTCADILGPGAMRTYGEPWLSPSTFESIWLPPRQFPEAGFQTIPTLDWPDWDCWDGFEALADNHICANRTGPDVVRRSRGRKLHALLTLRISAHHGSK
jgi:hypothetical protein